MNEFKVQLFVRESGLISRVEGEYGEVWALSPGVFVQGGRNYRLEAKGGKVAVWELLDEVEMVMEN